VELIDIYLKTSGSTDYLSLRVKDSDGQRAYVNAWDPQTFESFGILGEMKAIYEEMKQHVGADMHLNIKISRKKSTGNLPAIYYSLISIDK
jgi:hypothetical protein